jgi:predicted RNA methylase
MGKRKSGFYPTDPTATEALRRWLAKHYPRSLHERWLDPCAGYGGLLEVLVRNESQRYAIEIDPSLEPELRKRVPASNVEIGDGLARAWPSTCHVVMNPPFASRTMTAFVERAIERQLVAGHLVVVLALSSFWHSQAMQVFIEPTHMLAHTWRLSCDGTGQGDARTHDWLVWDPDVDLEQTRVHYLAKPDVAESLVASHRRLSSIEVGA